jgi:hypothetical protein
MLTSDQVCSRVSRFVAQNIRPRQKEWSGATQSRLSAIASFLGSIKIIKMLGISDAIEASVTRLREMEIEKAKSVRWMRVAYNASGESSNAKIPPPSKVLLPLSILLPIDQSLVVLKCCSKRIGHFRPCNYHGAIWYRLQDAQRYT